MSELTVERMLSSTLAFEAMLFAREKHKYQIRKYTGNPYVDHLAEVAGIVMTVGWLYMEVHPDVVMAVSWLHDVMEDQDISHKELDERFGRKVADGVLLLSDLEEGNRAARKEASRKRLAQAPGWVQTIKYADLISNTSSIIQHDPKFAAVYLEEKRLLLDVMDKGHPLLRDIAREGVVDVE